MKSDSQRLLVIITALVVAVAQGDAYAIPNPFKKKKSPVTVPASDELRSAEMRAAEMYSGASNDESGGRNGPAMAAYRKIVTDYPFTSLAPAAQFRIAAGLERDGKYRKGFDAYQELNETYRQSPQFAEAIERQFRIAMMGRTDKLTSFLGIKRKLDYEQVIEMLTKVIANAPQGPNAAEAQFEIAKIYEEEQSEDQSIAAYKKVAEEYPRSPLAAEAAAKVGQGFLGKVKDGSRNEANLSKALEATEEARSLFPSESNISSANLSGTADAIGEATAESSYKTGRFYEKKGNFRAALIYYADVLKVPGSAHYEEVRDRVNEMSSRDPKLITTAKRLALETKDLAVPAAVDVKSKPEYFGPPAPASKVVKVLRKPKLRSGELMPVIPLDEPDLPTGAGQTTMPENPLLDTTPAPSETPGLAPPSLEPMPDIPVPEDVPPTVPEVETILPAEPAVEAIPLPTEPAPTEVPSGNGN